MKTLLISILIPAIISVGVWFGIIKQGTPFGVEIPTVIALFETSLASKITSTATSMTLVSATDKDGNALSGKYGFILDEGGSDEEFVIADCTSTACTNMLRGISVVTGKTEVAALQHEHRRGASVKMTDAPILMTLQRLASGSESFEDLLYYDEDLGTTLFGSTASSSNFATKYYVDYVGAGGFTALNVNTSDGLITFGTAPETLGINLASSSDGDNLGGLYFSGGKLSVYASTSNPFYVDDGGQLTLNASGSFDLGSLTLITPLDELYGGTGSNSWQMGSIPYLESANVFGEIESGSENYLLSMSEGIPAWTSNGAYQNRFGGLNGWIGSGTGGYGDQNIASISVPAGTLGANGSFKITILGQDRNTTKRQGIIVKYAETPIASVGWSSGGERFFRIESELWNRNNAASQYYDWQLYQWAAGETTSASTVSEMASISATTINTAVAGELEFLYSCDDAGNAEQVFKIIVEPFYGN